MEKNYITLSDKEKAEVEEKVVKAVGFGVNKNEHNGFVWIEPGYTLHRVRIGEVCAECLMIYYNCLCSHDDDDGC